MGIRSFIAASAALAALFAAVAVAAAPRTSLVSVSLSGGEANGASYSPTISDDGRFVAFASAASNLVAVDGNAATDVFVRDRALSTTVRVSVGSEGEEANGESFGSVISGNGRFVVFFSTASNLVTGDSNGEGDIFVHDRDLDGDRLFDEPGAIKTARVSLSTSGAEVKQGPLGGFDTKLDMTRDGRFVSFALTAALESDDSLFGSDVYVRDRDADADGIYDETGDVRTTRVSLPPSGQPPVGGGHASISATGRFVAFNRAIEVDQGPSYCFVRDRDRDGDGAHDGPGARTVVVSRTSGGRLRSGCDSPLVSASGRFVLMRFVRRSRGLSGVTRVSCEVVLRDRDSDRDGRFDEPRGVRQVRVMSARGCDPPTALTPNGRFAIFTTRAPGVVAADSNGTWDAFAYDRKQGLVRRISLGAGGRQANGATFGADASAMGRVFVFDSTASNLAGESDRDTDVFIRGPYRWR